MKEEPYCPKCSSNEVVVDSTSAWDPKEKEYYTVSTSDKPWWCAYCEELNSVEWRKIE